MPCTQILVLGKLMQPGLLAWAAYRNELDFRGSTGIECSTFVSEPRTGTQVQVAWLEGGTAVFAFRGTSKQQDALQDLKMLRRNIPFLNDLYPGSKAHVGAVLPCKRCWQVACCIPALISRFCYAS